MNILSHLFLSQFFRATLLAGAIITFSAFTAQNVVAQETPPAKCEKCTSDSKCEKCAQKEKCTKCTDDKKCDKCAKKSKCAKYSDGKKCSKCAQKSENADKKKCSKCTSDSKFEKCANKEKCAKCTADKKCDKCAKKSKCAKCSDGKKGAKCAKKSASNESFSLTGEIIEIDADSGTLLVKHEAIEGVMPAMTMQFRADPSVLTTLTAGQKIDAQLKGDWLSGISVQ
jgi:Cu/Ag efflux protein CusF